MSNEEQDQIVGRLTREGRECRRAVAALRVKLAGFSNAASNMAMALDDAAQTTPKSATAIDDALAALGRMPELPEVSATLQDFRKEQERLTQIHIQLASMS